jgi:excisionase family DNA binding protein
MSIHAGVAKDGALVVSPKRAAVLLDIGLTKLYDLLSRGELESYADGGDRKITMRSIYALIERRLTEAPQVKTKIAQATAARIERRRARQGKPP